MKIAVLGSGNVGTALGDGWTAKGHTVIYGSRAPGKESSGNRKFDSIAGAIAQSEVVVLAVPWDAVQGVLNANNFSGKMVIDCTNPIAPGFELAVGRTTSAGEIVAGLAKDAHVVKAFNTTGFANMKNPRFGETRLTMLYASDDDSAKAVAKQLISDLGFKAVDAGPMKNARYMEPLAMLWISLFMKMGHDIHFQLVER